MQAVPEKSQAAAAPRIDLADKVTGRTRFVTDISVPGMLHAHVVRSPAPHARISGIDAAAALAMPGVEAVLTGGDLAGLPHVWGLFLRDRPLIAVDRVRYVGEPVAVVIARSEQEAEDAAEVVEVEYDDLPAVPDTEAALAAGAPLVHDSHDPIADFYFRGRGRPVEGTNIFHRVQQDEGDVDAAEAAAAHVIEDSYSFPPIFHYALEPHAVIADFGPDGLTLWSCGQSPSAVQKVCSRIFELPLAKVRVISPAVGGGFGGKASVKIDPIAAAASWKVRRPVRLAFGLAESMLTCRRLGARITIRSAVDAEGCILSKTARIVMDGGAYADTGPAVALKAANRIIGPYRIANLRIEALAVYTNTVPGAAFRSIGGPQAVFAAEAHMDSVAARIGLDPAEFRRRNLAPRGARLRPDLRPLDCDMGELMGLVRQGLPDHVPPDGTGRRARGFALAATDPGILPVGNALLRLRADGSVLAGVGSVEIGQGVRNAVARIVAELLNQPLAMVHVQPPDTSATPFDWGTGASRSTVIQGIALARAAEDLMAQLREIAVPHLGCASEAVRLVPGAVAGGDREMSIPALFHAVHGIDSGEIIGRGSLHPGSDGGRYAEAPLFWEVAAGGVEIGLDEETGAIRVHNYIGAADVGRIIDRRAAEGQEEGASFQGLGHTLCEELAFEEGQPVNALPIDYPIPTIADLPAHLHGHMVEHGDGPGPFGAKGMGEGGILPMAPAVANALRRGWGVVMTDLPFTPEKVWRALAARKGAS